MDYKSAGVDTELAAQLIGSLKEQFNNVNSKARLGNVTTGPGGFAGSFQPNQLFHGMELVACTDGVGTKIEIAKELNEYNGIGQDLVAMCVNDLYCMGAKPAFFLDYISCGKLDDSWYNPVLQSILNSCHKTGMALLGGETAEHPGVMDESDFDLAGFCVGLRPSGFQFPRTDIEAGDLLIALPSTGLHSNGFSLLRKLRSEKPDIQELQDSEWLKANVLRPTAIYQKVPELSTFPGIKAAVHITGGGIPENLPRVLPAGLGYKLDDWYPFPTPIYDLLKKYLNEETMRSTFNVSIGMVIISDKGGADQVKKYYPEMKIIGQVIEGESS